MPEITSKLSRQTAIKVLEEQMEGIYITAEQKHAMGNRLCRWKSMEDKDWPAEWCKVQELREKIRSNNS